MVSWSARVYQTRSQAKRALCCVLPSNIGRVLDVNRFP
jgi:hypothetical protein